MGSCRGWFGRCKSCRARLGSRTCNTSSCICLHNTREATLTCARIVIARSIRPRTVSVIQFVLATDMHSRPQLSALLRSDPWFSRTYTFPYIFCVPVVQQPTIFIGVGRRNSNHAGLLEHSDMRGTCLCVWMVLAACGHCSTNILCSVCHTISRREQYRVGCFHQFSLTCWLFPASE